MTEFKLAKHIKWTELGNGVKRQVLTFGPEMMLVKVAFETGASGILHQHTHVQISYVESGKFEYSIGNNIQILEQGDSCYIPSDTLHGCKCLDDGVLIDVFNPHREDFIA
jgi:quercetin dioxygenase-like cupin family protein